MRLPAHLKPLGAEGVARWISTSKEKLMISERNMKAIKRKAVSVMRTLTTLALAVPILHSTARAQAGLPESMGGAGLPIEGSWILSIDAGPVYFTAVGSFSAGGVFSGTGSLDRINPVSTLMGSWKRTGANRFDSTAYFFAFDPAGNAVAMLKTNQTFHLNSRNQLVGAALVFSCNLEGENCVSVSPEPSKVTGKRVVVE
jgi:hypothetical protein